MTREPRLPCLARWLLRLSPVPHEARAEVQADLHELFVGRRRDRGAVNAHWRLYHDVASLWFHRRPVVQTATPGSTLSLFGDARGDLRYAVRLFARQPAILLLTVVGLSLGLGIATAAFSIMNAALRGEGLVNPDRAPGVLRTTDRSVSTAWTYDEFLLLREGSTRMQVEAVLTEAALVRTTTAEVDAPSAGLAFVSGGFFAATGGRMIVGRPLAAADEQHAGPPPVVVSFAFWSSRLNRDPGVVGRTIHVGRVAATIVGVTERGFSVPSNRQLWMPLTAYGAVYDAAPVKRTPDMGIQVFGRLWPDVALAEAEAELSGAAAALPADTIAGELALRVRLDPHAGLGRVSLVRRTCDHSVRIRRDRSRAAAGLRERRHCAHLDRHHPRARAGRPGGARCEPRAYRQAACHGEPRAGSDCRSHRSGPRLLGPPGVRHDGRGASRHRPRAGPHGVPVSWDGDAHHWRGRRPGAGVARSGSRSPSAHSREKAPARTEWRRSACGPCSS